MSPSRERPSSPPSTARHVRLDGLQLGAGPRRSASSSATRRNRPRRDQPTASGSSSTAQHLPGDPAVGAAARPSPAPRPSPGRGTPPRPRPPAGPGPPPHRPVTTSRQASQVTDLNGTAAAVSAAGHATDRKSRIRSTDAVAALTSCSRRRPSCRRNAHASPCASGTSSAAPHASRAISTASDSSRLWTCNPAAPGRYATPAAARTPGPGPAPRTAAAPASTAAPSARTPPSPARTRPPRAAPAARSSTPPELDAPAPAPSSATPPAHHDPTTTSACLPSPRSIPTTAPSRGSSPRSRSFRAFRRRSDRDTPLPLLTRTSSLDAIGTPSPHYRTRRTSPPQAKPADQPPPGLRPTGGALDCLTSACYDGCACIAIITKAGRLG